MAGVFHFDSKTQKIVDGPAPRGGKIASFNYYSDAMAVSPNQAADLRAFLTQATGRDVEVNEHGEPRVTCRTQLQEIARARGFYARNGGYSDP